MKEKLILKGRAIVESFRPGEIKPYKTIIGENIALNEGMDGIWKLVCSPQTLFNNANARLGIGDNATIANRTQTGLLAEVVVDDAETNWVASTNVTSALDTVDRRVGASSVKLSVADLFTTGLIAHRDRTAINLTAYKYIRLWIKSSVARAAGDLRLLLDDTAGAGTPLETLSIPALSAGVWTQVTLALADPTLLAAIVSVGIDATVDPGICDIWLDDIRAVTTWYRGQDTGYPIFGTDQRATFKVTFAGDEANFSWQEWTVDNGLTDSPINLIRGQADYGVKIAGESRALTVQLTLAPA